MTYVNWETTTGGIRPEDSNVSILPNETASVGTFGVPWRSVYVVNVNASESAVINQGFGGRPTVFIVFGDSSSSDAQVLMAASSTMHRVFLAVAAMNATSTDARVIMAQENDEAAIPVLSLKQRDESEAFMDLEGACDTSGTKSLTTGNGNGSVVGPQAKNTASFGFEFAGMEKVRTNVGNGFEDLWRPLYRKVTS